MIKKVRGKWILYAKNGKEEIARFGSEKAEKTWEKANKKK